MSDFPQGTMLVVPKNVQIQGWIDYLDLIVSQRKGQVPVTYAGEIQLTFGIEPMNEYWEDWDSVILDRCPDLKKYVSLYVQLMTLGSKQRTIWEQALERDKLPALATTFPRFSFNAGEFEEGTVSEMYHYPVIEHTENMLKPLGLSSYEEPKEVYSPVSSFIEEPSTTPANLVLLAQKPSIHRLKEDPKLLRTGNSPVGYPDHVTMKLKVCTTNHISSIPTTHKYIIKR